MISRQVTLACIALVGASFAQATTVLPMTLPEVAAEADAIVRVQVTGHRAQWGQFHDAPAIVTELEFKVLEVFKGQAPNRLTVFGGTVGDQTLTLVGQPKLAAGSEAFLFLLQREDVTCPYVGVWQGVYSVREGQTWREGTPVVDVIDGDVAFAEDHERGMSPASFATEIRNALRVDLRTTPVQDAPIRVAPSGAKPASPTPTATPAPSGATLRLQPKRKGHSHPHSTGAAQ